MATQQYKAWSVVVLSTLAFTVCFMIWMMFAVIGIPIKETLGLNETEFGILIATPVLTGSLIRLPLGMWTDKFGGRIVFFILMLSTVIPIYLISQCTQYWQFLVTGLFVGVAGGSFTVGISYCARWFPKNKQGLAMGIFGAGNTGAAVTKLVAPLIVVAYGWAMVPQIYAVLMTVTALLFWFFTYSDPAHKAGKTITVREQLAVLKDPKVWKYSQYYSIVFGGYVALALWMTKYYIGEYGFDLKMAAMMAAAFSIPGGVLRAVGGYFSDKFGAHTVTWWVLWTSLLCLFFLSYPQTDVSIITVKGRHRWLVLLPACTDRAGSAQYVDRYALDYCDDIASDEAGCIRHHEREHCQAVCDFQKQAYMVNDGALSGDFWLIHWLFDGFALIYHRYFW